MRLNGYRLSNVMFKNVLREITIFVSTKCGSNTFWRIVSDFFITAMYFKLTRYSATPFTC